MKLIPVDNQAPRVVVELPVPQTSLDDSIKRARRDTLKFKINQLLQLQAKMVENVKNVAYLVTPEINALLETDDPNPNFGKDEIIAALKRHTQEYLNTFPKGSAYKEIQQDFILLQEILSDEDNAANQLKGIWIRDLERKRQKEQHYIDNRLQGIKQQTGLQSILMTKSILQQGFDIAKTLDEAFEYVTGRKPLLQDRDDAVQMQEIKTALKSIRKPDQSIVYIRPVFKTQNLIVPPSRVAKPVTYFDPVFNCNGPQKLLMKDILEALTKDEIFKEQLKDIGVTATQVYTPRGKLSIRYRIEAENRDLQEDDSLLVYAITQIMARIAAQKGFLVVNEHEAYVTRQQQEDANKVFNAAMNLTLDDAIKQSEATQGTDGYKTASSIIQEHIDAINLHRQFLRDPQNPIDEKNKRIDDLLNNLKIMKIEAELSSIAQSNDINQQVHAINQINALHRGLLQLTQSNERDRVQGEIEKKYDDFERNFVIEAINISTDDDRSFKDRKNALDKFKIVNESRFDAIVELPRSWDYFYGNIDKNDNKINPTLLITDPITGETVGVENTLSRQAVAKIFEAKDTSPALQVALIEAGYDAQKPTRQWETMREALVSELEKCTLAEIESIIDNINSPQAIDVLGKLFPASEFAQQQEFADRLSAIDIRMNAATKYKELEELIEYEPADVNLMLLQPRSGTRVSFFNGLVALRKRAEHMGKLGEPLKARVEELHQEVLKRANQMAQDAQDKEIPDLDNMFSLESNLKDTRQEIKDLEKSYEALTVFAQNAYNHVCTRDPLLKRIQLRLAPKTQEAIIGELIRSDDPIKHQTGLLMVKKLAFEQKIAQEKAKLESIEAQIDTNANIMMQMAGETQSTLTFTEWISDVTLQQYRDIAKAITSATDLPTLMKNLWGTEIPKTDGILTGKLDNHESEKIDNLLRVILISKLRKELIDQLGNNSVDTQNAIDPILRRMDLDALRGMAAFTAKGVGNTPNWAAILYMAAFFIKNEKSFMENFTEEKLKNFNKVFGDYKKRVLIGGALQIVTEGKLSETPFIERREPAQTRSTTLPPQTNRVTEAQLVTMLTKLLNPQSEDGKAIIVERAAELMNSSNAQDKEAVVWIVNDAGLTLAERSARSQTPQLKSGAQLYLGQHYDAYTTAEAIANPDSVINYVINIERWLNNAMGVGKQFGNLQTGLSPRAADQRNQLAKNYAQRFDPDRADVITDHTLREALERCGKILDQFDDILNQPQPDSQTLFMSIESACTWLNQLAMNQNLDPDIKKYVKEQYDFFEQARLTDSYSSILYRMGRWPLDKTLVFKLRHFYDTPAASADLKRYIHQLDAQELEDLPTLISELNTQTQLLVLSILEDPNANLSHLNADVQKFILKLNANQTVGILMKSLGIDASLRETEKIRFLDEINSPRDRVGYVNAIYQLADPKSAINLTIKQLLEMLGTNDLALIQSCKRNIIDCYATNNHAVIEAISAAYQAFLLRNQSSRMAGDSQEAQRARHQKEYANKLQRVVNELNNSNNLIGTVSLVDELKTTIQSITNNVLPKKLTDDIKGWFQDILGSANNQALNTAINNYIDRLAAKDPRHPVFFAIANIWTAMDELRTLYSRKKFDSERAKEQLETITKMLNDFVIKHDISLTEPIIAQAINQLLESDKLLERCKSRDLSIYDRLLAILQPPKYVTDAISAELKTILEQNPSAKRDEIVKAITDAYLTRDSLAEHLKALEILSNLEVRYFGENKKLYYTALIGPGLDVRLMDLRSRGFQPKETTPIPSAVSLSSKMRLASAEDLMLSARAAIADCCRYDKNLRKELEDAKYLHNNFAEIDKLQGLSKEQLTAISESRDIEDDMYDPDRLFYTLATIDPPSFEAALNDRKAALKELLKKHIFPSTLDIITANNAVTDELIDNIIKTRHEIRQPILDAIKEIEVYKLERQMGNGVVTKNEVKQFEILQDCLSVFDPNKQLNKGLQDRINDLSSRIPPPSSNIAAGVSDIEIEYDPAAYTTFVSSPKASPVLPKIKSHQTQEKYEPEGGQVSVSEPTLARRFMNFFKVFRRSGDESPLPPVQQTNTSTAGVLRDGSSTNVATDKNKNKRKGVHFAAPEITTSNDGAPGSSSGNKKNNTISDSDAGDDDDFDIVDTVDTDKAKKNKKDKKQPPSQPNG